MLFKKEFLRDIYPHASKWQVFKFKIRSMVRSTLNWITIASVAYMAFWGVYKMGSNQTSIVFADREVIKEIDTLSVKVAALEKEVIDELSACESAGHSEEDGIIIFDDNRAGTLSKVNKASIGQFQFKVTTVQHYEKLRSGKVLTNKEAVIIALDTEKAADLAKWIIFEQTGGIFNWQNCSNKYGLADKVALIKKIK